MTHDSLERQEDQASFQVKPRQSEMATRVNRQPQSPVVNHYRSIGNLAVQRKVQERNQLQEEPVQLKTITDITGETSQLYDFSDVRIHENSTSAVSLNALAYTRGNDIHFAPGQYKPNTSHGQNMLGHELTHENGDGALLFYFFAGKSPGLGKQKQIKGTNQKQQCMEVRLWHTNN